MDFSTILDLPFAFGLFVSSLAISPLAISPLAPSPIHPGLSEEVTIECTEAVLDFAVGGILKTVTSENCA